MVRVSPSLASSPLAFPLLVLVVLAPSLALRCVGAVALAFAFAAVCVCFAVVFPSPPFPGSSASRWLLSRRLLVTGDGVGASSGVWRWLCLSPDAPFPGVGVVRGVGVRWAGLALPPALAPLLALSQ